MSRAARRGSACVMPSPAVTGTALISAFWFLSMFTSVHRHVCPPWKIEMIYPVIYYYPCYLVRS